MNTAFDDVASEIATEDAWVRVSSRQLNGPGTLAVVLSDNHPSPEDFAHVDVGLVLNRNHPESPIAWDCVGFPRTDGERWLLQSVARWRSTAFDVVSDITSHSSPRAEHLDAGDPRGLADYHCVVGAGVAYGVGPFEALLEWAAGNSVLPAIEAQVTERFFHPVMNTLRIVYGGSDDSTVVEVQINGEQDPPAAELLAQVAWPRVEATWIKQYVVCTSQVS